MRASTESIPAPLVGVAAPDDVAAVLFGVLDGVVRSLVDDPMRVVGAATGVEGATVALALPLPLGVTEPAGAAPLIGAATALLGSTRAPTPHGMAAPPVYFKLRL